MAAMLQNDLTGKKFGQLTVLKRATPIGEKPIKWLCKCSCGNQKVIDGNSLKTGNTKTCGHRYDKPRYLVRKHSNRLYHTWSEMRRRCNGSCTNHQYYGDKGISYCEEWDDFDTFAKWAVENGYEPGLEIDRINGDLDYSPENCRWVTHKQNSRNRKARINNVTGTPGVQVRHYKSGKTVYRVTITADGANGHINIGTFETLEDAITARKKAELQYWGFNIGE